MIDILNFSAVGCYQFTAKWGISAVIMADTPA